MRFASLIVSVFAAWFFAVAVCYPPDDGDLAWQRWLGGAILRTQNLPRSIGIETFSAPGAPWLPQEWLFSLAAYLGQGGWWYLFASTSAIAAASALLVGALRSERAGSTPIAIAVATTFTGAALLASFGVRAQVEAWPLLGLFLLLLELDGPAMYWSIAVVAIWSNVHASVMIAPPVACVLLLGNALDQGFSARTKRLLYITFGALAATCANPFGWNLPFYALGLLSSPFKSSIAEWQYTDLHNPSFTFGALPLLLLLLVFGIDGPRRWSDRLLVLTTTVLMFSATRNVPLFAIACFPVVARSVSSKLAFLRGPGRPETVVERRAGIVTPIFAAAVTILLGGALVFESRSDAVTKDDLQPALAAISSLRSPHNVFCANFAWCSLLLAGGRERIFLDGRADPYPMSVWNDFDTIASVKRGWDSTLRKRRANVVLVGMKSPLEQALELSPRWSSVYQNATYRVWLSGS